MNRILWIFLLALWILLGLWFSNKYLCKGKLAAAATTTETTKSKTTKTAATTAASALAWSVADGSNFNFKSDDFLSFDKNSFTRRTPSAALDGHIGKLATYLKGAKDRQINITGLYGKGETNSSVLPTLGLARANNVKEWLTSLGVGANQIELKDRLLGSVDWKNNVLSNGIDLSFAGLSAGTDRLAAIKDRLQGKPITLYFGTNQDNVNLTGQQRQDFNDLNYYLDRVPGAGLDISGHTDATGNKQYNVNLSRERAQFVKGYLVKNGGVEANRMTAQGYGPDRPIAPNNTKEGRAKNRRVEVTLK